MIYVLTEPLYSDSPWCKAINNGLVFELEKNKLRYSTSLTDAFSHDERSFAFLTGSLEGWLCEMTSICEAACIHPIILSSQSYGSFTGRYSCITSDIGNSVSSVMEYLSHEHKTKTAIFGVNRSSVTNMTQLEYFTRLKGSDFCDSDVYYNEGSLSLCCDALEQSIDKYDSVICVNDFATVLLLHKMPSLTDKVTVICFGTAALTRKFFPDVHTVSMGYEDFGKAAISVMEVLSKNPHVDHINITVKCHADSIIGCGVNTGKGANSRNLSFAENTDSRFYSDDAVLEMMSIENMLRDCDETDMDILELLLCGYGYEQVSEKLFCAVNTVKYRVRKMKENCRCKSKSEMISLIKEYCKI